MIANTYLKKILKLAAKYDSLGYPLYADLITNKVIKLAQQTPQKPDEQLFQDYLNWAKTNKKSYAELLAYISSNQSPDFLNRFKAKYPETQSETSQNVNVVNDFARRIEYLKSSAFTTVLQPDPTNFGGYLQYVQNALNGFFGLDSTSTDFPEARGVLGTKQAFEDNVTLPISDSEYKILNETLRNLVNDVNEKYNKMGMFSGRAGYVAQGCRERIAQIDAFFQSLKVKKVY